MIRVGSLHHLTCFLNQKPFSVARPNETVFDSMIFLSTEKMENDEKTHSHAGQDEDGNYVAEFEARADGFDKASILDFRAKAGTAGVGVSASTDAQLIRVHDKKTGTEARFLGAEVGVDAGIDPRCVVENGKTLGAMAKAKLNFADCQVAGIQTKIGLGVSTGARFADDVLEAKVAGVGFKVGKEIGFSVFDNEFSFNIPKAVQFFSSLFD